MAVDKTIPQLLRSRDRNRLANYERNLQFYRGAQWVQPNRTAYARRGGQRQLVFNYARAIVTKSASYTMQGLEFVAQPIDKTTDAIAAAASAELAIAQVAEQNDLAVVDFENELDVATLGDAAYKVTWDDAQNRVRVSAVDVTGLWVWRRPDDRRQLWKVCQRYELDRADALALYGLASTRSRASIIEEWTDAELTIYVNDDVASSMANPYGFIPYIVYPNVREPMNEWGTSDLDAIRDVCVEYNRTQTQLSLIAELSGQPITVLENVNESTDIGVQPGAVWELPEGAKAYVLDLLQNGGVRILLDNIDQLKTTLSDLSETPAAAFGNTPTSTSGVAVKLTLDPLVKKIERKRLIRGGALTQRNAMILALLRQYAGLDALVASHVVTPAWGDINPSDRSRDIADAVALTNAAIESRHTAATDLGVADPDEELRRWLQEAAEISSAQPTVAPTPAIAAP